MAAEPPLGQEPTGVALGEATRAVLDYPVAVETGATVLAAERATEQDLRRLEELTLAMSETTGPFDGYRRADVRFHIALAEAWHSPRLVTAMPEVQGQMSDLIARIANPDEVLTSSNDQHKRLIALLRKGDPGPGGEPHARAHRGDRAHLGRPDDRVELVRGSSISTASVSKSRRSFAWQSGSSRRAARAIAAAAFVAQSARVPPKGHFVMRQLVGLPSRHARWLRGGHNSGHAVRPAGGGTIRSP